MYGSQPYAPLIRSDMGSEYGEENWIFCHELHVGICDNQEHEV